MSPSAPSRAVPLLSVVVPCYNEEAVIALTHDRIVAALGGESDFALEIVYVNDGSRDRTLEILTGLAERDARVAVVSFTRNFGHQPAVTAGLDHARGDAVAVIDADLQDPPEVIKDMMGQWRQGYQVVYAVRAKRKEAAWKRFAYSNFYLLLRKVSNIDIPLDSGDFCLLDRRVVDALGHLPERNRFVRGLRAWVGFRQIGLVYERQARAAGETKYPLSRLIRLAFDGIFNFSTTPLTAVFMLGLVTCLASLVAIAGLILFKLSGVSVMGHRADEVPGYTSTILAVILFGGVQLVSTGIIGEYVGRIYQEVKLRPVYLVDRVLGRPPEDAPPEA